MGFWHDMTAGAYALSIVWAVIIGLWLLKVTGIGLGRLVERLLLPVEHRILQWLQDRAMARTLGTDVDLIRARRKIETATTPVDMQRGRPDRY